MADIIPKAATDYIKNKNLKVGFSYKDVWHEEHATGFTVAKAMQFDVLSDVHNAAIQAVEKGQSFETFKKNLKPTLQQKGWWGRKEMTDPLTGKTVDAQLGSDRRLKTIYNTNMRNAFLYAKYKRIMDDPLMTHIMYISSKSSVHPRPIHQQWDGLILPKDDPWWGLHLPQKEYGCKCDFQGISEFRKQKYEKEGIPTPKRIDGSGGGVIPVKTEAPPEVYRTYYNERKGTTEKVPQGVHPSFNWDQRIVSRQEAAKQKLADSERNYKSSTAGFTDEIPSPPKVDAIARRIRDSEEIKKKFSEIGISYIDLQGLPDEVKEMVYAKTKYVIERFPLAREAVPGIIADFLMSDADFAVTNMATGEIRLNGNWFANIPQFREYFNSLVLQGVFPAGTDCLDNVTHEFGHAIARKLAEKYDKSDGKIDVKSIDKFCAGLQSYVLVKLKKDVADIRAGLSINAKECPAEFVADGFNEFVTVMSARKMAKELGRALLYLLGAKKW